MSSNFNGFSEEDIERLKSNQNAAPPATKTPMPPNVKKIDKIGVKPRKAIQQYRSTQSSEELVEQVFEDLNISFDKCKLSLKSPQDMVNNNQPSKICLDSNAISESSENSSIKCEEPNNETFAPDNETVETIGESSESNRKVSHSSSNDDVSPVVVSSTDSNYNETGAQAHTAKLEELQIKQKLMEEQNRRRKEMLSKALADRTKQTEEEVNKLEKIRRELLVLDGQLSQDVAVLRRKIDQACLTYAEAEKQYLRVEKEFLQAKIGLQKEKEKKELLTEHLCALIMHNETRKAQKLVTLMEQLASTDDTHELVQDHVVREGSVQDHVVHEGSVQDHVVREGGKLNESSEPVVVDGVDERTGKIVEMKDNFS